MLSFDWSRASRLSTECCKTWFICHLSFPTYHGANLAPVILILSIFYEGPNVTAVSALTDGATNETDNPERMVFDANAANSCRSVVSIGELWKIRVKPPHGPPAELP